MTKLTFAGGPIVSATAFSALMLCTALPFQAVAQENDPPATSENTASDESTERRFGTVTVTAQRRDESLVDVPISVAAFSGEQLESAGVIGMEDLGNLVPGLHVDSSGAFFQPSIRGVGTAIAGAGASANVATYVDGVYKPNALSNDFDFVDVESIQVLKGPQGTLFGRNATGGAILVTTKRPGFVPEFEAKLGIGSFGTYRGQIFASDALTENLAVSLAFGATTSDGWVHNVATGSSANASDEFSGRLKFLYTPNDTASFLLSLEAFSIDNPTPYAVSAFNGWSNGQFFGIPLSVNQSDEVSLDGNISHEASGYGVSLESEFDLGWADLKSITSGRWDEGYEYTNQLASMYPAENTLPLNPAVPLIVTQADWDYQQSSYSQEFNLSGVSMDGKLDWVTGLFLFKDETSYDPFRLGLYGPLGPGGLLFAPYPWPATAYTHQESAPLSSFTATNESYALFADVTYSTGPWHFTGGLRYSTDETAIDFTAFPHVGNGFASVMNIGDTKSFESLTPRAVVRYELNDNSSVYASFSQGTKAGLFNASGYLAQRDAVQPEEIDAIEIGYKYSGRDTQIEAAIFSYDYTDLQVATYIGGAGFFQNAKGAEIQGVDVHLNQTLNENFNVDIGLAYTDSEYTEFPDAALQTFDPIFGVQNLTADVSGVQMQRTPEFSGTLGLGYRTDLAGGELSLNGNYSYRTEVSFDFARTLTEDAYGLLNLAASWTAPNDHWVFSLKGSNVTDEEYLVQVLPNAGGFGGVYGRPSSVFFEISYRN